jgi:hypothetical protein
MKFIPETKFGKVAAISAVGLAIAAGYEGSHGSADTTATAEDTVNLQHGGSMHLTHELGTMGHSDLTMHDGPFDAGVLACDMTAVQLSPTSYEVVPFANEVLPHEAVLSGEANFIHAEDSKFTEHVKGHGDTLSGDGFIVEAGQLPDLGMVTGDLELGNLHVACTPLTADGFHQGK